MSSRLPWFLALPLLLPAAALWSQNDLVNWETPHVHPLELTPGGALLLAVNTPDNRLEVFDLVRGLPAARISIPVGLDPVSVRAWSDRRAWVVNHVSDSVSVVDLDSGNVIATLATDDEPCDVVFAGSPRRAFVSCSQANTVLVFDPLRLGEPPLRVPIEGEDPRAMAVSHDGQRVFVAIFESGNGTTLVGGGGGPEDFPPDAVGHPDGPWAGQNPPPNAGPVFDPPVAPDLPRVPGVGLIVRRTTGGAWKDDNGGDWTALVSGPQAELSGRLPGWTLLDHDVAVIDADSLRVKYADGLMNLNMALAVNPKTHEVFVVGTEATNEVRFEPNVQGTFVRSHMASFRTPDTARVRVHDLNPQLDYSSGRVPQELRDQGLGDPRGIVWTPDGTRAYVSGMGSNNVVVVDREGARVGLSPTIEVGQGPTGLALDAARGQLYVLNKFSAEISVVDTKFEREVGRVPFFDPTPVSIRNGRRHLYDTRATSGTGIVSCASCHVDARIDRLAWDLGDPGGAMKDVDSSQNLVGGSEPAFPDWHPMKGPMLTQTMQDIVGMEPFHWRGDRDGIEEFNPAFVGLLGDDRELTAGEMREFEDFLATIHYPPNPYRTLENRLATDVPLPGHYTSGRFGPAGEPLPNGNAVNGQVIFRSGNLLSGTISCVTCHTRPTGAGTDHRLVGVTFEPFPLGPQGENHLALRPQTGPNPVTLKIPQLRNLYERTGLEMTRATSTAGFGFTHDGGVDSLARFVSSSAFETTDDQMTADLVAFLLSFGGLSRGPTSTTNINEPPGVPSQATHAAVGRQWTLSGPADAAQTALMDLMVSLADQGLVGLVAKGRVGGRARGFVHVGGERWQSDLTTQRFARAALEALAAPGAELTFTVVPKGSERRIGIDRDADGAFDRDEEVLGTDPTDPRSRPRVRAVPTPPRSAPPVAVQLQGRPEEGAAKRLR